MNDDFYYDQIEQLLHIKKFDSNILINTKLDNKK